MDVTGFWTNAQPLLISFGLKLLGAIAIVVIGRWVIRFISRMVTKAMERQKVEPTIVRHLANTLTVGLNVLLFIGILGFFGVETGAVRLSSTSLLRHLDIEPDRGELLGGHADFAQERQPAPVGVDACEPWLDRDSKQA